MNKSSPVFLVDPDLRYCGHCHINKTIDRMKFLFLDVRILMF